MEVILVRDNFRERQTISDLTRRSSGRAAVTPFASQKLRRPSPLNGNPVRRIGIKGYVFENTTKREKLLMGILGLLVGASMVYQYGGGIEWEKLAFGALAFFSGFYYLKEACRAD